MKKIIVSCLALTWIMLNSGCIKDTGCTPKSIQSEEAAMSDFALANGINAVQHSSGLLYEILNPGSGATAEMESLVSVKYTGKFLNGTVFDSQTTTPVTFTLKDVIQGWRIGVPLIKEGGTIRLIIPSSYGYGCYGYGSIPPDAILYFEIELTDVQ